MTIITEQEVIERLKLCLPRLAHQMEPDKAIYQLALDSMDTVELLCVIHEEFGVPIREENFLPQTRLCDLARHIQTQLQLQPQLI
ncbi:acyl carrier protein [Phragmitibacter flavus]|uniref:Acyl carrier protein n=1 Tax=Phragmitibacter flavus TaxID=2576071 RepID=A0A5R8KLT0_9BACT|nr:phosphopantetheine-binding protein [Phragmitibacter flavus]TLD72729.1 acyl carrier protein [Phragmitibacter flavus]